MSDPNVNAGVTDAGTGAGTDANSGGANGAAQNAFDASEFKKTLMEDVTKMFNGAIKSLKSDWTKTIEQLKPAQTAAPGGSGTGSAATGHVSQDGKGSPEVNDRVIVLEGQNRELQRVLEDLKKSAEGERSQRLNTERLTHVNNILTDIPFLDGPSRELFFRSYRDDVKRDDEGSFVVETPRGLVTAKQYLTDMANTMPHLLKPKDSGGSGAKSGKATVGGWIPTMDDLSPANWAKMTDEQRLQTQKYIADTVASAQGMR